MVFMSDSFIHGGECHRPWHYGRKHSSLNVSFAKLSNRWCKIRHTIVPDPCIASTNKRSRCVARHTTHPDGILMWNELSPQQRVEIIKLHFQKDFPWELVCSYGSVRAGINDVSSSTSFWYLDYSTGCWILWGRHLSLLPLHTPKHMRLCRTLRGTHFRTCQLTLHLFA